MFDFDGVIVDSETMQARAWKRATAEACLRNGLVRREPPVTCII